jgi:hypothetical protein
VEQLWQQIKQRFLSNTTFQNYDDVIERSCQAWNEILSEDGFIKRKNSVIALFFVQIPKWKRTKNREIKQESSWENKFFRLYKQGALMRTPMV